MRIYLACVCVLMLAACSGNKSKSSSEDDDAKWGSTPKPTNDRANPKANKGGENSSTKAGDESSEPKPTPDSTAFDWDNFEPVANCDIEGNKTDFPNVVAFWDPDYRSVRIVLSVDLISPDMHDRLRRSEPLDDPARHYILSLNMDEGVTKLSPKAVATWSFDFYNLTDLSPMKLINLGKPTILELTGDAKAGAEVRVRIVWDATKVAKSPDSIHFAVTQKLTLR